MSDVFTLTINGKQFNYWQRVAFRQSVDDLAASLQLTLTTDKLRTALSFDANTVAQLSVNGALLTKVRLDKVSRRVSSNSHTIEFNARSLGRELIDTQYSINLKNLKLHEIVKRLCKVFNVPLNALQSTFNVADFAMQCESPANAILNAARAGNVLIYPTPIGGLIMAEPDSAAPVATLVMGQHIKTLTVNDEYALRFSEYLVKNFDFTRNASRKGLVKDSALTYYRPMHVMADRHSGSLGALQRRATLERNRRLARAHSLQLSVKGAGYMVNNQFKPWQINTQVRVVIPDEGIDDVMLIGDCEINQDDQDGTISQLTVMHRNAFVGETKQTNRKSVAARKAQS